MSALSGKRILVIEDEAMIAELVEDMLTELGAVVVGPAATIDQGFALAESETVDAALLDVNIRSERIDPIAQYFKRNGVPVVFATGYGRVDLEGMENAPVIEKPYTIEKLASVLGGACAAPKP